MEESKFLNSVLEEVISANFDQLVMVSHEDASHVYMLSNGRVKKGITFERNITNAFVEYFTQKKFPEPIHCELNETESVGLGKCFSVKITKL